MSNRKDVTVPMDQQLADLIDEQLQYGDSRAAWIRGAIFQRLLHDMDEQDLEKLHSVGLEDTPNSQFDVVISKKLTPGTELKDAEETIRIFIEAKSLDDARAKFEDAENSVEGNGVRDGLMAD